MIDKITDFLWIDLDNMSKDEIDFYLNNTKIKKAKIKAIFLIHDLSMKIAYSIHKIRRKL